MVETKSTPKKHPTAAHSRVDEAEAMIDDVSRRGLATFTRLFARAAEAAEDVWVEAKAIRGRDARARESKD